MELQKGIITKNDFFGSQSDYLAEYWEYCKIKKLWWDLSTHDKNRLIRAYVNYWEKRDNILANFGKKINDIVDNYRVKNKISHFLKF
jgi:hypothetical protein